MIWILTFAVLAGAVAYGFIRMDERPDENRKSPQPSDENQADEDHLRGTGGWLGLWISIQVFFSGPLSFLRILWILTGSAPEDIAAEPFALPVYLMNLAGFAGGIYLWREDPRGLAITLVYIGIGLLAGVATVVLSIAAVVPPSNLLAGALGVGISLAWGLYFLRSKRVENTYLR